MTSRVLKRSHKFSPKSRQFIKNYKSPFVRHYNHWKEPTKLGKIDTIDVNLRKSKFFFLNNFILLKDMAKKLLTKKSYLFYCRSFVNL